MLNEINESFDVLGRREIGKENVPQVEGCAVFPSGREEVEIWPRRKKGFKAKTTELGAQRSQRGKIKPKGRQAA